MEQNCRPLSEVTYPGTPNLEIQPLIRASAQLAAEVDQSGITSTQCVDLSTTVNKWVKPAEVGGRGPTRSMWMWLNRWVGLAMWLGGAAGCDEILDRWHCWQSLHQAAIWEAKHGQKNRLEINRFVAMIPGYASL